MPLTISVCPFTEAHGRMQPDPVVFADDLGVSVGGLDQIELAIDMDLFELVEPDNREIVEHRDVSRRHLETVPVATINLTDHDFSSC